MLPGPFFNMPVKFVLILPSAQFIAELYLLCPGRIADDLTEGFPFFLIGNGNRHPLVFALTAIASVRSHNIVPVAGSFCQTPVYDVVHLSLSQEVNGRFN